MNKRKIAVLVIIGLIFIVLASNFFVGFNGSQIETIEYTKDGYKYAVQDNGVILFAEQDYHCSWKPDGENDNYKICSPVIVIWNNGLFDFNINSNQDLFQMDINKITKSGEKKIQWGKDKRDMIVSSDYEWYNETLINNSCLNNLLNIPLNDSISEEDFEKKCSYQVEKIRFSNWHSLKGEDNNIKPGEVLGIKLNFELPQYESAQYNFSIPTLNFLLDPDISACGDLVIEGATYNLTQNITGISGDCFIIKNDSITLDMKGYNITGDETGIGVGFGGYNETTIKNGYIYDFYDGIKAENSKENVINNMTISSCTRGIHMSRTPDNNFTNLIIESSGLSGFYLYYSTSKNNILTNITSSFNGGYGIYMYYPDLNNLTSITTNNNNYGIYIYNTANNNILTNITANLNNYGIAHSNSNNNNFTNVTSTNNDYSGIYLTSSSNNNFTNIITNTNGDAGIFIDVSSDNNILTNTTTNSNTNYGIYIKSSSDNNILTNVNASLNVNYDGVWISGSDNNLTNITANSNGQDGIELRTNSNNNLTNVNASLNGDAGVELLTSTNNNLKDINTSSNTGAGVFISSNSDNNTLTNITTNLNDYGIILDSSSNNNLTNITANSNDWTGIDLDTSSNNNNFTNITANSNFYGIGVGTNSNDNYFNNFKLWNSMSPSFGGLIIWESSNNTFENGYVNKTTNAGIYFRSTNIATNDNLFKNMWINNTDSSDIYFYINSNMGKANNNTFVNVSFNSSDVDFLIVAGGDMELIRKWYFQTEINESLTGNYLENANVTAYNISDNVKFSVLTNSTGQITRQELIEYITSSETIYGTIPPTTTYHTPHTIDTTRTGYTTNSTIYNLTITNNIFHIVTLTFTFFSSTETLTQGQAYEGVRVPWEFNDNWTIHEDSPDNWTNVTKTYSLSTDCGDVYIEIDGVNASDLVNSSNCNYTVRNNKTLEPGDSSLINITYTTTTTSSEANWIASNKIIYQRTNWINYLTISNPSIHDYTNISINITTDKYAVPVTINVKNSTPTVFSHTFDNTNGNVNWSLPLLDSGDDYVFTIEYKTPNITLTKVNYSETILGKDYEIHNVTIEANSTRSITNVYSYFNFSDEDIIANRFYKCDNGLSDCTEEISNRGDVVWEDQDSDGAYDYVEWRITNLTQNQSYQLKNDKGFPVEITEFKQILNPPIKVFDNIEWEVTLTMYNPNAFATEKVYKYEFPLGSMDIELDDIGKNLQYSLFGGLAPYITIIDKDQSGDYPNSVYLPPGETKTFIIEYRTDSVTIYSSTYFPTYFEVDKNALIVNVLRINNQAEDEVTDIEYRIPIDYAENLIVCETERTDGCIEDKDDPRYDNLTLDTKDSVKGDYKLEIDSIDAGESKMITLSYYIPTATVESVEKGRRSVQGVLADYKKVTILSTSPYTMDDLRYKETEIKTENVIDIFECQVTGICDIPLHYSVTPFRVKLGTVGIGEKIEFFIWSIPEGEEKEYKSWFDDVIDWFVENVWNGGKKIEITGFWKYIIGWMASKDIETGQYFVPVGRLILIGSIVGLIIILMIWIRIRRRRKSRKET